MSHYEPKEQDLPQAKQEIINAVNELHGDIANVTTFMSCDNYLIFSGATDKYVTTEETPIVRSSALICTIEEFNQCVKDLSGIADTLSHMIYVEYLLKGEPSREPLTKENSDYSYYEHELAEIKL